LSKVSHRVRKSRVQFLIPQKLFFCTVVWKAVASTHYLVDHPQRMTVGAVELGTVLRVMDTVENRALVKCPSSGWSRHYTGWLPKQQFAWLTVRAKDGTDILKPVLKQRPSIRSSVSRPKVSRIKTSLCAPWNSSSELCPSNSMCRKPRFDLDFREKPVKFYTDNTTSNFGKLECSRTYRKSDASSLTNRTRRTRTSLIELNFKRIDDVARTSGIYLNSRKNFIPLEFKYQTSFADKVNSRSKIISKSSEIEKVSSSISKNVSETNFTGSETKPRSTKRELKESPAWPECRLSISIGSDVKFIPKNNSMPPSNERCDNLTSSKGARENLTTKKQSEFKLAVDELKLKRSITSTSGSGETKLTSRSGEVTEQEYCSRQLEGKITQFKGDTEKSPSTFFRGVGPLDPAADE